MAEEIKQKTEEKNEDNDNQKPDNKQVPQVSALPKPLTSKKSEKPKSPTLERMYIIPLKREYLKVPKYKRTARAVKTVKKFIARHMKVSDRDLSKIKLDPYFNNWIWKQGKKSPPNKIKVKAIKSEDIVTVSFAEIPDKVKFAKEKNERLHKKSEVKKAPVKSESQEPQKTEEEKTDEKEKEQAVAESHEKEAKQKAKADKHTAKVSKDKSAMSKRQVLSRH